MDGTWVQLAVARGAEDDRAHGPLFDAADTIVGLHNERTTHAIAAGLREAVGAHLRRIHFGS